MLNPAIPSDDEFKVITAAPAYSEYAERRNKRREEACKLAQENHDRRIADADRRYKELVSAAVTDRQKKIEQAHQDYESGMESLVDLMTRAIRAGYALKDRYF